MESGSALEGKKQRVLRRLESTIESANELLYEINRELETIVGEGSPLERAAEVYETWVSKE